MAGLAACVLVASVASASQGTDAGARSAPGAGTRSDAEAAVNSSSIRGRVTTAGGQPVATATVKLESAELPGGPRTAVTDTAGQYEFSGLRAGRYSISASKVGFLTWSYGQTSPVGSGRPLVLKSNQALGDVDIRLPRGGVIRGRVVNESGEAVVNATVTPVRVQFSQGQQRLTALGVRGSSPAGEMAATNDRGEFRIFGVAPGEYYVSASAAPPDSAGSGTAARNGYAPAFSPGTADVSSARRISLNLEDVIEDVDIVVVAAQFAAISGYVVDARGSRVTRGGVTVSLSGGPAGIRTGPILQDGTFAFQKLAPGEYVLRSSPVRAPSALGQPIAQEVPIAIVTVNGVDLAGVRLAPAPPVAVRGRISFDDPRAASSLGAAAIRLKTLPLDGVAGALRQSSPLLVKSDFSFELKTPPGLIAVRVDATSTPSTAGEWRLKAIRVDGADVTDRGIDTRRDLDGVEIVLTNRLAQISVTVRDITGALVKDYVVVVFSQDRTRWSDAINRYVAIARPNREGVFQVATLPPGQYYAIALDRVGQSSWQDPEYLEVLSHTASMFSLVEGKATAIGLTLFSVQ